MKLNRKAIRKMILKEMMGPKSPSDYLKPHLRKHGKHGTDPDTISHYGKGDVSDYSGTYEDYRDNIDSQFYHDHMAQFDADDSDADPNEVDAQFVGRALDDLEQEGDLTNYYDQGSEGYRFDRRDDSDEELGLVDDEGKSQLYERKLLQKMILQELSKLLR